MGMCSPSSTIGAAEIWAHPSTAFDPIAAVHTFAWPEGGLCLQVTNVTY